MCCAAGELEAILRHFGQSLTQRRQLETKWLGQGFRSKIEQSKICAQKFCGLCSVSPVCYFLKFIVFSINISLSFKGYFGGFLDWPFFGFVLFFRWGDVCPFKE